MQNINLEILPFDSGLKTKADLDAYLQTGSAESERILVGEIWNTDCDQIVLELADKYAWYVFALDICLISDFISKYLPSTTLEDFKNRHKKIYSGHWKFALTKYGSMRLYQMDVKLREPKLLTCPGCGSQFLEWSVSGKIAKKVDFNIIFCSSCYRVACWHGACANHMDVTNTEMLDMLGKFCMTIENIPTISFMNEPILTDLTKTKQIEIIKLLLTMPSYKDYVEIFGSWINSLIQAGVLGNGVLETGRGYHCVAIDGHICLSLAEKAIDDWLTNHNVEHIKEPLYPYNSKINPTGKMRGDWKVKELFIEYVGLIDNPAYYEKMMTKKELANQLNFPLLIIQPADIFSLDNIFGEI